MKTEAELRQALAAAEEDMLAKLDVAVAAEQEFKASTQAKQDAMVALMRFLEDRNSSEDLEVFVGRRAGKTP